MINWTIVFGLLVGLTIFLYAIESFSKEILRAAGDRFRRLFQKATKNRFIATISGMVVTALIQSSSATTVITISLVSAGVISFAHSLGIIIGANIGTTITAQLVAFKITTFAPAFIIIGFLISLLKRPYHYMGKGIFYFGLVFFGLNLISETMEPLRDDPRVFELLANLDNPYIALLVGILFTALVNSSSVVTGLVVILAASGVLTLEQGIPILLGTNIGTTVTALYASMRLSPFARRAAIAHTFFNVGGVLLIWPFIAPFGESVSNMGGSEAQQIANAHTIFNVLAAILFLILFNPFKSLVERFTKIDEKEILISPKYLKGELPHSNRQAFELIEKEMSYFLTITHQLNDKSIQYIQNPSNTDLNTIEKLEVLSDLLDERIEQSLLLLSKRSLSEKEAKKVVLLIRISNIIEQVGDTGKKLSILPRSMTISSLSLSQEALKSVGKIYQRLRIPMNELQKSFPKKIRNYEQLVRKLDSVQTATTRSYREHVKRLKTRIAEGGSIFVESSSILEGASHRLKELLRLNQVYSRMKESPKPRKKHR